MRLSSLGSSELTRHQSSPHDALNQLGQLERTGVRADSSTMLSSTSPMLAAVYGNPGGSTELRVREVETPEPGPG